MILGVWGVVMLLLLGVFYRVHAAALAEDLPIDEEKWAEQGYDMKYIYDLYAQNSTNCFIAGALYVAVTLFSFVQYKLNARANYSIS